MLVDFKLLSDSSKLWVFQSDKIITPLNQKFLTEKICPFLNDWSSHGAEIKSSFEIVKFTDDFWIFSATKIS